MSAQWIEIANVSDVGKRRPHNEDSTLSDLDNGLVILADGMGGYKAGEVASAIAVTSIHHRIVKDLKKTKLGAFKPGAVAGSTPGSELVKKAITQTNSIIYNTAQKDPDCHGMGTTVVVALFHDNQVIVAHVGDSRLYRKRGAEFSQVTKDHSLIQELINRGLYTPEEAAKNAPKNLVTRALGIDATVEVDVQEQETHADDIYLLCSDGLNDMVGDEEIHLTLSKYSGNLLGAGEELVRLANSKGGRDNTSVILIRVKQKAAGKDGLVTRLFRRSS
jgi:protein phosphatase